MEQQARRGGAWRPGECVDSGLEWISKVQYGLYGVWIEVGWRLKVWKEFNIDFMRFG